MIDTGKNGLNVKISQGENRVMSSDLNWDDVEDGTYPAVMTIVYPWKELTRDTKTRVRDEDGKFVKNELGEFVKEELKDYTWSMTDLVFVIEGGIYDGHAVKGSLSTHPDMIGSAKRFLYNAELFDVELADIYKHTGSTKVNIIVKHRPNTFKDKKTGVVKTTDVPYVSYYEKYENNETGI